MNRWLRTTITTLILLPCACQTTGGLFPNVGDGSSVDDLLGLIGDAQDAQQVPPLMLEPGALSAGQPVPSGFVSVRLMSAASQSADVTVRFELGDEIVHLAFLRVRPDETDAGLTAKKQDAALRALQATGDLIAQK